MSSIKKLSNEYSYISIEDLLKLPTPMELFVCDDNNAMEFSISPVVNIEEADYLKKVKSLIQKGGGDLRFQSNVIGKYTIPLIKKGDVILDTRDDIFKVKFILDCVKERRIIDLNLYRANKTKYEGDVDANLILNREKSWGDLKRKVPEEQYVSDFSDDENAKSRPHVVTSDFRKLYTFNEDKAIVNYIVEKSLYRRVKGNVMWRQMETSKTCLGRPWSSLRERFNKKIIHDLSKFKLDSKIVKKLLNGSNEGSTSSDSESHQRYKKADPSVRQSHNSTDDELESKQTQCSSIMSKVGQETNVNYKQTKESSFISSQLIESVDDSQTVEGSTVICDQAIESIVSNVHIPIADETTEIEQNINCSTATQICQTDCSKSISLTRELTLQSPSISSQEKVQSDESSNPSFILQPTAFEPCPSKVLIDSIQNECSPMKPLTHALIFEKNEDESRLPDEMPSTSDFYKVPQSTQYGETNDSEVIHSTSLDISKDSPFIETNQGSDQNTTTSSNQSSRRSNSNEICDNPLFDFNYTIKEETSSTGEDSIVRFDDVKDSFVEDAGPWDDSKLEMIDKIEESLESGSETDVLEFDELGNMLDQSDPKQHMNRLLTAMESSQDCTNTEIVATVPSTRLPSISESSSSENSPKKSANVGIAERKKSISESDNNELTYKRSKRKPSLIESDSADSDVNTNQQNVVQKRKYEKNSKSTKNKSLKYRTPFTMNEDMKILLFIEKYRAYSLVKGVTIWNKMEARNIVEDRTWQSLKERYLKRIIPHIHRYKTKGLSDKAFRRFCKSPSTKNKPEKKKPRKKTYREEEDLQILEFISKNKRYSEIGGVRLWKLMEGQIEKRTWQSLKNRFLKHILKNLESYTLCDEAKKMFLKLIGIKKDISTSESELENTPPRKKITSENSKNSQGAAIQDEQLQYSSTDEEITNYKLRIHSNLSQSVNDTNGGSDLSPKAGEISDSNPKNNENLGIHLDAAGVSTEAMKLPTKFDYKSDSPKNDKTVLLRESKQVVIPPKGVLKSTLRRRILSI